MIWQSTSAMTVVDVFVMSIAGYTLWVFFKTKDKIRVQGAASGALLIALGVVMFGAFYFVDLFAMHVLSSFIPREDAMAATRQLHLNANWFIGLAGMGLIVAGFLLNNRQMQFLIGRLESAKTDLVEEIAGRKRTEAALRTGEARLRRAHRMVRLGHWKWSAEGRHLEFSLESATILGVAPVGLPTRNSEFNEKFVHPDDRANYMAITDKTIDDAVDYQLEYRILRPDGEVRHIVEVAEVTLDSDGRRVGTSGTIQDVTDRARIEEALRTGEARLRHAHRMARLCHWEWSSKDDRVDFSPEAALILGVAPDDLPTHDPECRERFVHPDDRAKYAAATNQTIDDAVDYQLEYRILRPDGEVRHIAEVAEVTLDSDGRRVGMLGTIQDVTDRARIEEALRTGEAQLRHAHRLARLCYWEWSPKDDGLDLSPEAALILGVAPDDLPTRGSEFNERIVHPDDRAKYAATTRKTIEDAVEYQLEYRILRPDGEVRHISEVAEVTRDNDGRRVGMSGTIQDVTAQARIEAALREREARLANAHRLAELGHWTWDEKARRMTYCSEEAARILGGTQDDAPTTLEEWLSSVHPDDREHVLRTYSDTWDGAADYELEYRIVRPDGEVRFVAVVAEIERDAAGEPVSSTGTIKDITDRKRAEAVLQEAHDELETRVAARTAELLGVNERLVREVAERERTQRELIEKSGLLDGFFAHSGIAASIKDLDGRYLMINPEFEHAIGVSGDEVKGKTVNDLFQIEPVEAIRAHEKRVIGSGRPETWEHAVRYADGTIHAHLTYKFPVLNAEGERVALGTIGTDITERKRAEESLRLSERRLADAQRIAHMGSWVWDIRTDEVHGSDEVYRIYGLAREEMGKGVEGLYARAHPEDRARIAFADRDARAHKKSYNVDYRIVRPDGDVRHIFEMCAPECDETGRVVRVIGTVQDVTERKRLEQQLDQTAKLATLGEMAAGMAHELNQPLHIIRMGADSSLLLMEVGEGNVEDHAEQFKLISGQSQRMAEIIDHMQIFGRVDDEDATRFDPAAPVAGAIDMVGERFRLDEIQISTTMAKSRRAVHGRPVRLEQVMLNLLNNARDAILTDPRLSAPSRRARRKIDVKVVDDRRKKVIRISVTDNGGGIPEDVLGRVFEPFFTTKEVGEGTGLGLSISYGIVADMGGTIAARTVRDKTCFEISLPVCADA